MGTNKTVEVVETPFGSTLRIKTKDRPLASARREKLVNALVLASEVLFHAGGRLMGNSPLTPFDSSILDAHMKCGSDLTQEERMRLRKSFIDLCKALRGDLTVADSFSSVLNQELRTTADKAALQHLELEDALESRKTGFELGIDSVDEVVDAEMELKAFEARLKDRARDAARSAIAQARNEMGFVKPHKPFGGFRTAASGLDALPLEPKQWGSIHINFETMLTPQRTDMEVAVTLIHEGSHKFLDTLDFAYVYEPKYQTMRREEALRNADSYAFAAASLRRLRLMKSKADLF